MIRVLIYDFGIPLICFVLFSALIYFGVKTKKSRWKYFLYNSAAVFIAIFIFEIYSHIKNQNDINNNVSFSGSFYDTKLVSGEKEFVGYGPKKDTSFQVTAIRKNNDSIIYNVNYTFENGERYLPNNNDTSNSRLFFLGGSHVFGDGLNDNQTLPFFINNHSNQQYNISNYGFSGYGTHQALKILEHNILIPEKIENPSKACVIYSFIPSHIERAAGHSIWDPNGPQYEFENKQLIFKGSFNENRLIGENYLTLRLKTIWKNSYLFKSVFYPRVKDKDIIRVAEIINTMNTLLKEKNVRFIVILGRTDIDNENEKQLYAELDKNNIEYYYVTTAIPDLNTGDFTIVGDGHPNGSYNSALAKFIIKKLN